MKQNDLIILAAGENAMIAADIVKKNSKIKKEFNILGYLDDNVSILGKKFFGYKVIGKMDEWKNHNAVVTSPFISSPKNNILKYLKCLELSIPNEKFVNIVHHSVDNTRSIQGNGNLIVQTSLIFPKAVIGSHCYISAHVLIGPHTIINDYVNLSNGCSIQGKTEVGQGAYIGANSSIIGGISIGKWSIVGMGSVVIKPVKEYEIVAGNPARVIGVNKVAKDYFQKNNTVNGK